MKRKILYLIAFFAFISVLVFSSTPRVGAAYTDRDADGAPYETSKSDRTIIKEIHVRQDETLKLLKDIKEELRLMRASVMKCAQ